MSKREFLMLAHDFVPHRNGYTGYYVSQKLDGMRAYWDGGVSRGLTCELVPWANTAKHARFLIPPVATGLWTRYGQPIHAPAFWLDTLPKIPLDGELICGNFQQTMSVCKDSVNLDPLAWHGVGYHVFDIPPYQAVFSNGEMKGANYKKKFRGILEWLKTKGVILNDEFPYYKINAMLDSIDLGKYTKKIKQEMTPDYPKAAKAWLEERLAQVASEGGEGLMLRSSISFWRPERSYDLLKLKVFHDMEGTVVGYTWGKATDVERSISGEATDRLLGLMGSVRLRLESGVEFDLASGFTLEQRKMNYDLAKHPDFDEPHDRQGQEISEHYYSYLFPRGCKLTFRYRELTNDGVPKEARFLRCFTA